MNVNLEFRKSSYSGGNGNCVEVADTSGFSVVRDTQNRDLGVLTFGSAEWYAFLSTATSETR